MEKDRRLFDNNLKHICRRGSTSTLKIPREEFYVNHNAEDYREPECMEYRVDFQCRIC